MNNNESHSNTQHIKLKAKTHPKHQKLISIIHFQLYIFDIHSFPKKHEYYFYDTINILIQFNHIYFGGHSPV